MNYISIEKAIELAKKWNGGDWSILHSFTKTKVFNPSKALIYLKEIEDIMKDPEYALRPYFRSKKHQMDLLKLKRWFLNQARESKIEVDYKKHPVYGYMFPVLKSHPEDIQIEGFFLLP